MVRGAEGDTLSECVGNLRTASKVLPECAVSSGLCCGAGGVGQESSETPQGVAGMWVLHGSPALSEHIASHLQLANLPEPSIPGQGGSPARAAADAKAPGKAFDEID